MMAAVRTTAPRLLTAWKPSEREAHNTYCCQLLHSGGSIIIKNFASI